MKHLIIISIYLIAGIGCSKSWDKKNKLEFMDDCREVYGTNEVCFCVLSCLEKEYDNYFQVLNNVPKQEPEKVFKKCLKQCN